MAVAFLLASFLAWRRMRLDYAEGDILSLVIVLALLSLVGFFAWHILSIAGVLVIPGLGLILWCKKLGWNVWEWLDTLVPISLVVAVIASLTWGPNYQIAAVVLLVGVVISWFLQKNYRKLHWYKNGKVGFVGLTSLMWWFGSWAAIANWHVSHVYWGGLSLEAWVSIWATIAAAITLYVRGGRRITQDWRQISKIWQTKKSK